MDTRLHELTISQAHSLLAQRQLSSVELTRAMLQRVEVTDKKVKACLAVTPELALAQADRADKRIAEGDCPPLCGVPVLLKDNISTRGVTTTCGSRILEDFMPIYDATVTARLKTNGAVILGKTNMDEFAMGSSTENSAFFPTRNPWDLDRVPGGSSGGSAAAVSAREAAYALGSDTGGSIRQPAGFCSVVGLKPTYGLVSRYGLVAFASSLDQIGPFTRDVTDCALVLTGIAGHDPRDATSSPNPASDYTRALVPDVKGLKIGIPREYFSAGVEAGVERVLREAISVLQRLGAQVDWEVSLPHTRHGLAVYYILAPSEASANLARYDGVKYGFSYSEGRTATEAMSKTRQHGFGAEVKRRIMLGTYALSAGYYDAYYLKAQKVRTLFRREFDQAFQKYDALVTPTSPTVPFRIGEKSQDPLQMYLSDICTIPVNIAGIPAISIPAGFVNGLPVGMQIMAQAFHEETLLRVAFAYEQATNWHKMKPPDLTA